MDEEGKKMKNLPATKFVLSEVLKGTDIIPIEVSTRLLPHTISINELGKQLLKASGEGDVQEIRNLMSRGAPFTADWLGTSPLHLAAQNNHLEACEVLLRAGISRDARTKVDRTPLHMASYEGHIAVVECLLRHGADYDCKDLLSMTPLHWAAQNGHAEVVAMLIRFGAITNPVNKFELTPMDIALQIKRHDITEIICLSVRDPILATKNLALEMHTDSNESLEDTLQGNFNTASNSPIPLETILLEDDSAENSIDPERLNINQKEMHEEIENVTNEEHDNNFTESIRFLQQHGITMLPADDNNIFTSAMENGHSVVLTDVGKEVLNSTKDLETVQSSNNASNAFSLTKLIHNSNMKAVKPKRVYTLSTQEFLAMTSNLNNGKVLKQVNGKLVTTTQPNFKRIVMKKNKVVPISVRSKATIVQKLENIADPDSLMKQLIESRRLLEEYKQKFVRKEAEAEKYKQQLRILMQEKLQQM